MRARLLTAILTASVLISTPCQAETCHELTMSYIHHDQSPQKAGQTTKTLDGAMLVETTAYNQGTHGSHGDKMRTGYVAYTPETYGYCMEIYEAIPTDAGYEVGEFIGLYEIRDCGYGRSTGTGGASSIRADKDSRGTIESGLSVDRYAPTLNECREWMRKTKGMIFIRLIEGKG